MKQSNPLVIHLDFTRLIGTGRLKSVEKVEPCMAQFDFLGTWKDSWSIISAVLEPQDVCLIPDLKYEQPQPHSLMTLNLKAGYKEVLRRMKTQLVRHQFHEPIWIGLDALHRV